MAAIYSLKLILLRCRRLTLNYNRISILFSHTARFRFERLLLLGREASGTCLLTLDAYAPSRTPSSCWEI